MASQVLSGTGNVSYTNNTGQNVRIVINYMASPSSISWAPGAGINAAGRDILAIGRNLAFSGGVTSPTKDSTVGMSANNMALIGGIDGRLFGNVALPTELMLAPGQTFSANCGAYNIVVIPEAG